MSKKQFSVDPVVPSFVLLVLLAFFGGIYAKGAFLTPPPPDLKLEYCRGIADGDMGNYINIQRNVQNLETDVAQNGLVLLLAIANPETGQVMQSKRLAEWLPDREEGYFQVIEDACMKIETVEKFAEYSARGPSNMPPTPTEVTTP